MATDAHDVRQEQDRLQQLELEIYSLRSEAEQAAERARLEQESKKQEFELKCEQQVAAANQAASQKEEELQQKLLAQLDENSNFKSKVAKDESRVKELELERHQLELKLSLAQEDAARSFEAATQVAMSQVAEDQNHADAERTRLQFEDEQRRVLSMEQKAAQDEQRIRDIMGAEAIEAEECKLKAMEAELSHLRLLSESAELDRLKKETANAELARLRSEAAIALAAVNPEALRQLKEAALYEQQVTGELDQSTEVADKEPDTEGAEVPEVVDVAVAVDVTPKQERDISPSVIRGKSWRNSHTQLAAYLQEDDDSADISPEMAARMRPYREQSISPPHKMLRKDSNPNLPIMTDRPSATAAMEKPRATSPAMALRGLLESAGLRGGKADARVGAASANMTVQQPVEAVAAAAANETWSVVVPTIDNVDLVDKIQPGWVIAEVNGAPVVNLTYEDVMKKVNDAFVYNS